MSPKEKAKELVEKFYWRENIFNVSVEDSKECAIIAVNEILQENKRINLGGEFPTPLTNYWQEVKQEIEKL